MSAHSKFAPSSSARWSVCTANLDFIEAHRHEIPPIDWSFAARGTRAHDAGSKLILNPSAKIEVDDEEMRKTVHDYAAFIRSQIRPDDRVLIETKVNLFYAPQDTGTVDAAVISDKRIFIGDYKDGVGVGVYAKDNTQLAIYAESLIQQLELVDEIPDNRLIVLAIYQPRDRLDSNPIRLWALDRKTLREFTAPIGAAKERIIRGDVEFKAGPHCDKAFCPVRGLCKHYGTQGLTAISDEPVDAIIASPKLTQLPPGNTITREQRQRILAAKPALEKWLGEIEAQEVHALLAGAEPQKFKLVRGKSNRAWANEAQVRALLETLLPAALVTPAPPPQLVSPAQAEKLLSGQELSDEFKASLSALITKPEGKPTLVPVADKRPALVFNPADGLSKIEPSDADALI